MQVLLYEHITGGGFAETPWELGFASQAFAMMNTMVHALLSANYDVHLLYDNRINSEFLPKAKKLNEVSESGEWKATLARECDGADYTIIIAPEDDMILVEAIKIVEKSGTILAGSNSESVSFCSDKAKCNSLFEDLKLEIPQSIAGTLQYIHSTSDDFPFPAILKKTTSSGATSLHYLQRYENLDFLMDRPDVNDSQYILQKYVKGIDASVSLIITDSEAQVLTVNKQNIQKGACGTPSKYLGGECPLDHPANKSARDIAIQIVDSIPGLNGYIGIDFVFQGDTALPVEVNPRLTVSSVGISRVMNPKILASVIDSQLMEGSRHGGYAAFSQYIGILTQNQLASKNYNTIPGIVSPPVQLDSSLSIVPPYLCAWGNSITVARKELSTLQKKLASGVEGGSG